jgi:predicted RNA-binding protein with PUA-like domain
MQYWILKTEPETYSFNDLLKDKKTKWDGVRNYQARNNIRSMKPGDLAVIYESVGPKAAVGVAKILSEAYQELKSSADWSAVDIGPVKAFQTAVTLSEMKADKVLKNMKLVKQSRLSVCPLTETEFEMLLKKGGVKL